MTARNDENHVESEQSLPGTANDAKEARVTPDQDLTRHRKPMAALDPIASALRRLHDDVASEPIPDDFMNLLASIDEKREGRPS